ncbi:hypothetical protein [Rhizobium cauense]|uniref:hypothetical protein n=1 Tax=Rhizobium cauense TaxID=1166683 RepID=UPI003B833702
MAGVPFRSLSVNVGAAAGPFGLVAAGYVSRNADPNDKRRQTLALTAKAETVLKRLTAIHLTEIRELAPRLIGILHGLQDGLAVGDDPWSDHA